MEIRYHLSPYPSLTEDMVAKVYETASPNSEVASIVIPTPHNNPHSVQFTGLDRVPHIVKLFTASGAELHSYDQIPVENVVTIFDPIFFKIGDGQPGTPIDGTNFYTNAVLDGMAEDEIAVFRDGRLQYPNLRYQMSVGGGFVLVQAGDIFETDAEWMIQRKPSVVPTPVNDSVVGKITKDFLDVNNVSKNYDPTDLRKIVRLRGPNGKYYFTAGVPAPANYGHRFSNVGPYGSLSDTPYIYFNDGGLIFGNTTLSSFPLPWGNIVEFSKDVAGNWNLTMYQQPVTQGYGRIVHLGREYVGDIPDGSQQKSIQFNIPPQPDTNYFVSCQLFGQSANPDFDNDVFQILWNKQLTTLTVVLRQIQNFPQNLFIEYAIMRVN